MGCKKPPTPSVLRIFSRFAFIDLQRVTARRGLWGIPFVVQPEHDLLNVIVREKVWCALP